MCSTPFDVAENSVSGWWSCETIELLVVLLSHVTEHRLMASLHDYHIEYEEPVQPMDHASSTFDHPLPSSTDRQRALNV